MKLFFYPNFGMFEHSKMIKLKPLFLISDLKPIKG